MSYSATQFEQIAGAIHRKTGKKIARDQEALLEKDESWIHQLRKKPHGAANVPEHVLQTVMAAHEARLKQQTSRATRPPQNGTPEEVEYSQPNGTLASSPGRMIPDWESGATQPPQNGTPEAVERSQPNGTLASSPERMISDWEQSPEHRPRRDTMPSSSLVQETPHPQLARRQIVPDSREAVNFVPMSSQDEEEELDVQLPRGADEEEQQDKQDSFYKYRHPFQSQQMGQSSVRTTNTPPCAQPDHDTIPGTVMAEPTNRARVSEKEIPTRRFKPINFGDESPTKGKREAMATRGYRMQSLKHLQVAETQDTVVSSSVVPGTLTQTQTQRAGSATREADQDTSEEVIDARPSASVAEESSVSRELLSAKSHLSQDEDMDDASDHASTPLYDFGNAYPDYSERYSGTQLNFVKACLCLEYLRGERALRDFLYDDFIRLFSHGYLDYVNGAGPAQQPLSAIEWFNLQTGPPLYTRQVMTNDNIDAALTFYEADVATIRGQVAQQQQEEEVEEEGEEEGGVEAIEAAVPEDLPELLPGEVQDSMETDAPQADAVEIGVVKSEASQQPGVRYEFTVFRPMSQPASPAHTPTATRLASTARRISKSVSKSASPMGSPIGRKLAATATPTARAVALAQSSASPVPLPIARRTASPRAAAAIAVASTAPSRHVGSPQLGSGLFFAQPPPPPSSMRSNAAPVVGSQYMEELARRPANESEEDVQRRRERMRAAMRRRAAAKALSVSSYAGSAA